MSQGLVAQSVLRAQADLAEGPHWDARRQVLWWVDIERGHIHSFDPVRSTDRHLDIGHPVGAVVCRENGGLLVASQYGIATCDPETGAVQVLHHPEADQPGNRFNDGKCDPDGRFWAGTMEIAEQLSTGSLYSLDKSVGMRKHFSGIGVSNGLAWSADSRRMYYVDSKIRTVDCFDFDRGDGSISNRRVVFEVPTELQFADGMAIDADDNLWVAFWGGWCVAQVDPRQGKILTKVELPASNVTSCCFGGPTLEELYITTAKQGLTDAQRAEQSQAGDLFMVRPGVVGTASVPFKG
jgi:sugar lactone lactonase YvrE